MASHTTSLPYRQPSRQPSRQQSRQMSVDPHHEVHVIQNHYIGIDVGTGSARACIMNEKGDIVGLASENIGLWQPETGYYVRHPLLSTLSSETGDLDTLYRKLIPFVGAIYHRHLAVHL